MFEKASQFLLGNPLIDPNDFTDLVIDVYLDGLDTSKLKIPNAEEIMKDPIKREQWRQMMLSISGQNMLKLATKALQGGEQKETPPIPGGEAQPGQPPTPQVDNTGNLQAPQLVNTGGVNV
jgi:hypothetical protein